MDQINYCKNVWLLRLDKTKPGFENAKWPDVEVFETEAKALDFFNNLIPQLQEVCYIQEKEFNDGLSFALPEGYRISDYISMIISEEFTFEGRILSNGVENYFLTGNIREIENKVIHLVFKDSLEEIDKIDNAMDNDFYYDELLIKNSRSSIYIHTILHKTKKTVTLGIYPNAGTQCYNRIKNAIKKEIPCKIQGTNGSLTHEVIITKVKLVRDSDNCSVMEVTCKII